MSSINRLEYEIHLGCVTDATPDLPVRPVDSLRTSGRCGFLPEMKTGRTKGIVKYSIRIFGFPILDPDFRLSDTPSVVLGFLVFTISHRRSQPVRSGCSISDLALFWTDPFYTVSVHRPGLFTRLISIPAGIIYAPVRVRTPERNGSPQSGHRHDLPPRLRPDVPDGPVGRPPGSDRSLSIFWEPDPRPVCIGDFH